MHSLAPADFIVLSFYLGFLLAVGLVFRRFNRTISDYFRGGGSMLWWMSGASAMMSAISAWSFTGAAGSVYDTGLLVAVIYWSNGLSLLLVGRYSCGRFRRMRVVTYAEAVRRRYGGVTEQFYVWMQLPVSLVKSGIELSALGVFMSAVFHTALLPTIGLLGIVVIFVALWGGAWAVVAGDFLQSLLMLVVTVLATWFVLRLPEIGGWSGLINHVAPVHWRLGGPLGRGTVVLWCGATLLNSLFNFNNMAEGAARFLTVRDEAEARKAAFAMAGIFMVIPALLLIPALAATAVYPDLTAQFPALRTPHDAAFVSLCLRTMPEGVIGLLAAGIFAVAMASMDTGLNRNSGLLVRNVYQRFIRPEASQPALLWVSKGCTLIFGLVIVGLAILVSVYSQLDLFNLILAFGALVGLPLMIPTVLGLFIRRAPTWAGWTTPLVGLAVGWTLRTGIGAAREASWIGWRGLTPLEVINFGYAATVLGVIASCGLWYGFTIWVSRHVPEPEHVRAFFADLARPIDRAENPGGNDAGRQYRVMGTLALVYGAGVAGFAAITTSSTGRGAFIFCGGVILGVGALLRWAAAREVREAVVS